MTDAELLSHFQGVREVRGGWKCLCPAHADQTPSLAIVRGDRCFLFRCWAGCTYREIIAAVGLRPEETFFDYIAKGQPRPRFMPKPAVRPPSFRHVASSFLDDALDEHLIADSLLADVTGHKLATCTSDDIEEAWEVLDCGRRRRLRAEALERVAVNITAGGLRQEWAR